MGIGDKAEKREALLKDEAERERKAREEAEKRVYQLEMVLDRMGRGELPVPGRTAPSTPLRTSLTSGSVTDFVANLSPTVAQDAEKRQDIHRSVCRLCPIAG